MNYNVKKRFTVFAFVFFQSFIFESFSEAEEKPLVSPSESAVKEESNSSTGVEPMESQDFRTGNVAFEHSFFKLKVSSRLTFEVGLSFNKTMSFAGQVCGVFEAFKECAARTGFGGWNLEIPRIIGSRYEDYVCGRSSGFLFVQAGQAPIRFMKNNRRDLFPNADYISTNNWVARCKLSINDPLQIGTRYSVLWKGGYTANADFEIVSPQNVTYNFNRLPNQTILGKSVVPNIDSYRDTRVDGISFSSSPFYPTGISDGLGNFVQFNFLDGLLGSIQTNQGQSIKFIYNTMAFLSKPPKGGSAVNIQIPVLRSIGLDSRVWTLNYSRCTDKYGLGCFDFDWVDRTKDAFGHMLSYILRSLQRPDGATISFKYRNMRSVRDSDFFSPRPGVHYQVSEITRPSGLVSSYNYHSTCQFYFNGLGRSETGRLIGLKYDPNTLASDFYQRICSPLFAINYKKYSTPTGEARSFNYYYHVPGFQNVDGLYSYISSWVQSSISATNWQAALRIFTDEGLKELAGTNLDRSLTFEIPNGTQKLNTYVFKRDYRNSEINDPLSNKVDAFLLLQKSTLIAPDNVPVGLSLPAAPKQPPNFKPTVGTILQSSDGSITINLEVSSEYPLLSAVCMGNNGLRLYCEIRNNSVYIPNSGIDVNSIEVYLLDIFGNVSEKRNVVIVNPGVFNAINQLIIED